MRFCFYAGSLPTQRANFNYLLYFRITPGAEKPVNFAYDMIVSAEEHIPKVVDSMIDDWIGIAKLFHLIVKSQYLRHFGNNSPISVKSFTWNKLILYYGPNKGAIVTVQYSIPEKVYKLSFGKCGVSVET